MLHSAELRPPKEDTCGGERAASPPGGHPSAELLFSTFPDFFICDFYICAHIKPVCHVAENEKRTRWERDHSSEVNNCRLHLMPTAATEPWLQMARLRKKDDSCRLHPQTHTSAFSSSIVCLFLPACAWDVGANGNKRNRRKMFTKLIHVPRPWFQDHRAPRPTPGIPGWSSEDGHNIAAGALCWS